MVTVSQKEEREYDHCAKEDTSTPKLSNACTLVGNVDRSTCRTIDLRLESDCVDAALAAVGDCQGLGRASPGQCHPKPRPKRVVIGSSAGEELTPVWASPSWSLPWPAQPQCFDSI